MGEVMVEFDYADVAVLTTVADLLYEPGDPRRDPWPDAASLGRLRSHLRGLADAIEQHGSQPTEARRLAELAPDQKRGRELLDWLTRRETQEAPKGN